MSNRTSNKCHRYMQYLLLNHQIEYANDFAQNDPDIKQAFGSKQVEDYNNLLLQGKLIKFMIEIHGIQEESICQ